jgi:hypothetical protein
MDRIMVFAAKAEAALIIELVGLVSEAREGNAYKFKYESRR